MVRDRVRVRVEYKQRAGARQDRHTKMVLDSTAYDGEDVCIKVEGKDRDGIRVMHIHLEYDPETRKLTYRIDIPEEWSGTLNDYVIEQVVLQRLTNGPREAKR